MQDENHPKETLINYFTTLNSFIDIIVKAKTSQTGHLNYLITLLNLKFPYPIQDSHFYHFVSEAWLLGTLQELKKKYIKELEENILLEDNLKFSFNKSYKQILQDIHSIDVDANFFIDCLEVLLGTFKLQDPVIKVTQMKLSNVYLEKTKTAKSEILDINIPDDLTKEQFEQFLFQIMLYGLGYTLNELDPKVTDKKSKILIDAYVKIDNTDDFEVTFEKYVEELNQHLKQKMSEAEIELLNLEKTFFNFAKYQFHDILDNIKVFNVNMGNSATLIYDLSVDKMKKIYKSIKDYITILKSSESGVLPNYLYNDLLKNNVCRIYSLGESALNSIVIFKNNATCELTTNSIGKAKQIKESLFEYFGDNIILYKNLSPFTIHNNLKSLIIYTTGNTYNVIMNTSTWTKEAFLNYLFLVKTIVNQRIGTFKNLIFEGDSPMLKITSDNEKYLHLEIRKNLTLLNVINDLVSKFRAFDMVDYSKQSIKNLIYKFRTNILQEDMSNNKKIPTPYSSNIHIEMAAKNASNNNLSNITPS
jgi:hypothetical protein